MSVKQSTQQLKEYIIQLRERFYTSEPPESFSDREFFYKMKEETGPINNLLDEWATNTLNYIENNESLLYPHQIEATKENIQLIIVHSYYIDVRKRIYMEYYQSSIYILDQLLSEM